MNSTITTLGILSAAAGFVVSYAGLDIVDEALKPSDLLPPAIEVKDIVIRDDASVLYEADILTDRVWQAWSATIFDLEGDGIHCNGGDVAEYKESFRYTDWDADYMVGGECNEGLKPGMRWVFIWTPLGPDYAPVRYPEEGYGVVVSADSATEVLE